MLRECAATVEWWSAAAASASATTHTPTHPLTHPKQHHRQNSTAKSVTLTLAPLFAPPLNPIAARVFSATKIGASACLGMGKKSEPPPPPPKHPKVRFFFSGILKLGFFNLSYSGITSVACALWLKCELKK
jgi:hypothetical protein